MEQFREENVIGTSLGAAAPVTHQVTNHEPQEVEKTSSISFGEWRDLEASSELRSYRLLLLAYTGFFGLVLTAFFVTALLGTNKFDNVLTLIIVDAYLSLVAALQHNMRKTKKEQAEQEYGMYLVNLSLSRNGCLFGTDVGTVMFQNGYLIFEGSNTSFSFSTRVIDRRPAGSLYQRLLRSGANYGQGFRYFADGIEYELRMTPRTSNTHLSADFKSWLNWSATSSHDVLPPRVPTRGSLELTRISTATDLAILVLGVVSVFWSIRSQWTSSPFDRTSHLVFSPTPWSLFQLCICAPLVICVLVFTVLVPSYKARSQRDILAKELEQARSARIGNSEVA